MKIRIVKVVSDKNYVGTFELPSNVRAALGSEDRAIYFAGWNLLMRTKIGEKAARKGLSATEVQAAFADFQAGRITAEDFQTKITPQDSIIGEQVSETKAKEVLQEYFDTRDIWIKGSV
jgi:cation transport regulator ChaB